MSPAGADFLLNEDKSSEDGVERNSAIVGGKYSCCSAAGFDKCEQQLMVEYWRLVLVSTTL